MEKHIITPTSPEALERLKDIEVIYTDLDGTMFAPGGRVLVNHAGKPSCQLGEAIYALKDAGVEIIIVTGRDRGMLSEIIRLLDLNGFMGEIGTVVQYGIGELAEVSYLTGDMPYDPKSGKTPYQVIKETGIVKKVLKAFPGKLEYRKPWSETREVTHMLRGRVELEDVQKILDTCKLPLVITDNGRIDEPKGKTSLDITKDIHAYHIMPRGCSKAAAVKADIARRGISADKTAAIGDALTDVIMGEETGVFCTVQNGLESANVVNAIINQPRKVIATVKPTIDGWVEFANAILQAKGLRDA